MTDRRGFLRGLAGLPLIGGGVTLIGTPTAAAEPVAEQLLDTYLEWLNGEIVDLVVERRLDGVRDRRVIGTAAFGWRGAAGHPPPPSWRPGSSRAAVVLSAVGCDWREGRR